MVKPAISVIVPVYNIAAKVGKCIQSIQAQSFQDFELIVVDDGSRDGSGEICDKMADSRTKVIHQENAGVTRVRAHGVEIASGEWVHFVDGDDVIPEGALQALVDACQGVDIVVGQVASMRPGDSDNILPPPNLLKNTKKTTSSLLNLLSAGFWSIRFPYIRMEDCSSVAFLMNMFLTCQEKSDGVRITS